MTSHLLNLYNLNLYQSTTKQNDIVALQKAETQMTSNSEKRFQYIKETICRTAATKYIGKKKYMIKNLIYLITGRVKEHYKK